MIAPAATVLGVGLLAACHSGLRLSGAIASRHWPSTTGRVIRSAVNVQHIPTGGRANLDVSLPTVEYEYAVNDIELRGDTVSLFGQSYSYEEVATLVDEFPVGQKITVYYDPVRPSRSVLFPGGSSGSIELVCDLLLIVVGLWWVMAAIGR